MGFQLVHLVVGNGIDQRQVGDLHVNFRGLFCGFNEAEGFVQDLACAVGAMVRPDHKAEVHLRGTLHVLGILARVGNEEVFPLQLRAGKARGNLPQNRTVHIVGNLRFLQQQADVAAVVPVSAVVVHIRYGASLISLQSGEEIQIEDIILLEYESRD